MPSEKVRFVSMIIDLLLTVLEKIASRYLGDRPYSPEEETFLEIFNNFRDTWSYYNLQAATYATWAGKKRPRSPRVPDAKRSQSRGNGGYARNSSDDEKVPSDDNDKAGAGPSVVERQMCTVCNKEICPVCGECHGGNERSSPSSDCVEVEVVEESPVAMTISSSGNNDDPKSDSDSSGVSPAALRLYRSAVEGDNTGGPDAGPNDGADAGPKEGDDAGPKEGEVPSSSSSDDDGEK
jgi:hypothetical protein